MQSDNQKHGEENEKQYLEFMKGLAGFPYHYTICHFNPDFKVWHTNAHGVKIESYLN